MSINKRFNQIMFDRGKLSEQQFFYAMDQYHDNWPEWLYSFAHSTNDEDKAGIDAWVETDVGRIPLQLKSSVAGKLNFIEKHPSIPVLIIKAGESGDVTFDNMLKVVEKERNIYLKKRE